jgi:hypothetical protein
MRMIVEAFKDTLELGLSKPEQIVVCIDSSAGFHNPPDIPGTNHRCHYRLLHSGR